MMQVRIQKWRNSLALCIAKSSASEVEPEVGSLAEYRPTISFVTLWSPVVRFLSVH
jgi:hypothetical protein